MSKNFKNIKINILNILFGGFMINENIKGVRVSEKAFLTLKEASEYFNIGQDKVRQLTDENDCDFVLFNGSKRLIKKKLMVEYLNRQFSI